MMDLGMPLNHWHWWILAAVLSVAEVLVPGIFFIWIGIAAGVTGVLVFAADGLDWKYQVLVFGLLAIASAVAGRQVYRGAQRPSDHPTLNRRGAQYIGQAFTLDAPIVGGVGKLRVADTTWKVAGPDCPAGTAVRIVAAEGVLLRVEPVSE